VVNNVSPLFILSFCRHDPGTKQFDHGLLSQWRAYGETGGFAMEFDEDGLDEALKIETKKFAYGPIKSDDVRYSDYGKLFDAKMYQGVAGEMIRKMFEPRDVSAITGRKNFDEVVVVKAAPFMKHEGFSEEREYRICAVCIRPSHIPKGSKERPKRIKFRSRSGMIVPYIDLLSRLNFNLPLKSIIVGPHPFQERQMDSIKLALEDAKFPGVTVRMSAIPFRI
jgi:Protein of unknown function (DUF2971)